MLKNNDKKNSFWLALQYIIAVVFAFVNIKLNLLSFGPELFGMWIVFLSLWGIGSAVDLGFGTAIIKYVAEARIENDTKKANSLISTGFVIFCAIGIMLFMLGTVIAFAAYFSNTNIVPSRYYSSAKAVFFILGFNFLSQYLSVFFKSILEGISDFVLSSKLIMVYNCLVLLSVFITWYFSLSIEVLAAAYLLSSIMLVVLNFFMIRIKYPEIQISLSNVNFSQLKGVLKFSASMQISSLLASLIDPIIKYVISNFSSLSVVPLYEIARRFASAISGLFFASFRTLLPKTSILKNKADYQEFILNDGRKITGMGVVYSGIIFGVLSLFIAVIIKLWFGYNEIIVIFLILALPESMNNFGYTMYMFLIGIGRPVYLAYIQAINVLIITLSLIGGFWLTNSILGLLGYYVTVIMVNFLMMYFVKKISGFSINRFLGLVKFYKLLILNILLTAAVFLLYFDSLNFYSVLSVLSVFSLFVFYKDIKTYFQILINMLKQYA